MMGNFLQQLDYFLDELIQTVRPIQRGRLNLWFKLSKTREGAGGDKHRADKVWILNCWKRGGPISTVLKTGRIICLSIILTHVYRRWGFINCSRMAIAGQTDGSIAREFVWRVQVENLSNRKIVVFYRPSPDMAISKFETDFSRL